jgi:hypothetical protein
MRKVGRRAEQLLRDRNAVVYCMHGFCVTKDDVKALVGPRALTPWSWTVSLARHGPAGRPAIDHWTDGILGNNLSILAPTRF